jgi:hypothetical protein
MIASASAAPAAGGPVPGDVSLQDLALGDPVYASYTTEAYLPCVVALVNTAAAPAAADGGSPALPSGPPADAAPPAVASVELRVVPEHPSDGIDEAIRRGAFPARITIHNAAAPAGAAAALAAGKAASKVILPAARGAGGAGGRGAPGQPHLLPRSVEPHETQPEGVDNMDDLTHLHE